MRVSVEDSGLISDFSESFFGSVMALSIPFSDLILSNKVLTFTIRSKALCRLSFIHCTSFTLNNMSYHGTKLPPLCERRFLLRGFIEPNRRPFITGTYCVGPSSSRFDASAS
ncbi:hypothetical protein AVEN_196742-1 [Araneus ventricosus]|uniref:Uncharacterized protein n=1 Tax=Araneus ventricosus TaxID=182803 RepID=A0A4Y2P4A5_ARAVE|nr:hypothetical protein AVEN_196742-1 [Araneus ventricosus]